MLFLSPFGAALEKKELASAPPMHLSAASISFKFLPDSDGRGHMFLPMFS